MLPGLSPPSLAPSTKATTQAEIEAFVTGPVLSLNQLRGLVNPITGAGYSEAAIQAAQAVAHANMPKGQQLLTMAMTETVELAQRQIAGELTRKGIRNNRLISGTFWTLASGLLGGGATFVAENHDLLSSPAVTHVWPYILATGFAISGSPTAS